MEIFFQVLINSEKLIKLEDFILVLHSNLNEKRGEVLEGIKTSSLHAQIHRAYNLKLILKGKAHEMFNLCFVYLLFVKKISGLIIKFKKIRKSVTLELCNYNY